MKKLYGVTTAMVTPFNKKGAVNLNAVVELTEFLIEKGVHGLYPLGTTGEMLRLNENERKQIAEAVIQTNSGRVTVYIHIGAMTLTESVALACHAVDAGADGIGVMTPVFFGASDRELENYFVTIAHSVPQDFPVYLYNIPQCASNNLTAEVARRIVGQCSNIIGIKYSFPDFLMVNNYLEVRNFNFSVLVGTDRLFLPALSMGCDGVVSGVSCAYPEPFIKVYEAFKKGNILAAREAQRVANKYCELLHNGNNMSYFKEALKYRGIEVGGMRAPQLDLSSDEIIKFTDRLHLLEQQSQL